MAILRWRYATPIHRFPSIELSMLRSIVASSANVCVLAAITVYGVSKLQGAMMNSEQYYNDPRHPRCMSPLSL